jgi:hypothetical protein
VIRVPGTAVATALTALALAGGLPTGAPADDARDEKKRGAKEAAPESGPPSWYAQALARGPGGLNVTHFWSKGPMLRAETVVVGHKVVTIVRGEWYYAYDGVLKTGMAIRRDPAAVARDAPGRRPFGNEYESLVEQGAELVREENMVGRATGVYRITDDHGRRELWVTMDPQRIPLRIEIYDRKSSTERVTDYVNWQSALFIPDSFFEPDPSIELERIELDDYVKRSVEKGPVGPVPVLYTNLLHVKKKDE